MRFMLSAAAVALAVAPFWIVATAQPSRPADPTRLVGYGCEGATGPLYRAAEDEFPTCKRIEPIAPGDGSPAEETRQCIERAQASGAAGQVEAGRAWWREAGRAVYGEQCRDDWEEVRAAK